jgi:hypothetical protein
MGKSSIIPAGGKSSDVRDCSIHLFESLADARNSQNALAIQPAERPTNDPAMTSLRKWQLAPNNPIATASTAIAQSGLSRGWNVHRATPTA